MKRDVVVTMVSDTWSDAVRRGFLSTADQTVLSLLASPRIRRVLVVDHPRGVLSQVKRRAAGDRPAPRSGKLRGTRPVTLRTELPTDWDAVRRRYRAHDRQVQLAARREGLRDPALVGFDLFASAIGGGWASSSAFYAQDDETAIPRLAHRADLARRAYAEIDESRAHVVAVSRTLLDRIAPGGGTVIPNGIDPALWRHPVAAGPSGSAAPRVAVYAGTVDSRLDVEAFHQLAGAGWQVRLLGPVADPAVGRALERPGVTLVGQRSREEVVAELGAASLCVLAHRSTPLTEAMSPLKLYEYVASGTPVVATRLSGIAADPVSASVVLVDPGGDYMAAADEATRGGRTPEGVRRRRVDELSWRARHEALLDLIT